mgnify:CR=1 FL=1
MKKFVYFTFLILTVSCSKNKSNNLIGIPYDDPIHFAYVDSNGNDLLNANHPNKIEFATLRLYRIIDGTKQQVIQNGTDNLMGISMNCGISNTCTLAFKLSDSTVLDIGNRYSDTICFINNRTKITYNNEVIWEAKNGSFDIPLATIVK